MGRRKEDDDQLAQETIENNGFCKTQIKIILHKHYIFLLKILLMRVQVNRSGIAIYGC